MINYTSIYTLDENNFTFEANVPTEKKIDVHGQIYYTVKSPIALNTKPEVTLNDFIILEEKDYVIHYANGAIYFRDGIVGDTDSITVSFVKNKMELIGVKEDTAIAILHVVLAEWFEKEGRK